MATAKKMCCVMGCPIANAEPKGTLLVFPPQQTRRYRRWLAMYPNSFVLRDIGGNYICRRHFSAESFDKNGKLKLTANPTMNPRDTNHARDQILETFLIKVIYEWSLRTASTTTLRISWAAREAASILGLKSFIPHQEWIQKFKKIRAANLKNGLRFIGEDASGRAVYDIIRDLRKYLPSTFVIPMDITGTGGELTVKNECLSEDETAEVEVEEKSKSNFVDVEGPEVDLLKVENEVTTNTESWPEGTSNAAIPKKDSGPLDTYQDALAVLKPLEAYIKRIGNDRAMARIREITSVLQEAAQTEQQPRRGVKRPRAECV